MITNSMNDYEQYALDKALRYAARDKDLELIRRLLAAGADINARDSNGWTALHWAVDSTTSEFLKLLIEAGADVNVKSDYGYTPLHHAAMVGNIEIIILLVEAGADMESRSADGTTPINVLNKRFPDLYKTYIDALISARPEVRRLGSEDKSGPSATGFEYDI